MIKKLQIAWTGIMARKERVKRFAEFEAELEKGREENRIKIQAIRDKSDARRKEHNRIRNAQERCVRLVVANMHLIPEDTLKEFFLGEGYTCYLPIELKEILEQNDNNTQR